MAKIAAEFAYPCTWTYKIIGPDQDELYRAASEIICDRTFRMILSRRSENGKYHSFDLEVVVESAGRRIAFYEALRAHKAVKIVL